MSSILKVDTLQTAAGGVPTAADLGLDVSGTVLQVKHNTDVSTSTTTSTSWTNSGVSGLNLSITPKSSQSKIVMIVNLQLEMNSSEAGSIIFARDPAGTPVYFSNTNLATGLTPGNNANGVSKHFLSQGYTGINGQTTSHSGEDSPSTTSSVTYGILWGVNGGTAYYNTGVSSSFTGGCSSITLMEIAG